MTKAQLAEQQDARTQLRKHLPPGSTVYTILRHCARSGMYRAIDVYVIRDNEPLRLTFSVAKACGMRYDRKHEAIGIGGCGMDMGFAIVNDLAHYLYPDGFQCVGDSCPSSDHSNGHGNRYANENDRDGTSAPFQRCERSVEHPCAHPDHQSPGWHASGAYALSHRWLG